MIVPISHESRQSKRKEYDVDVNDSPKNRNR